jgi:CheY-like chemotaxis protein
VVRGAPPAVEVEGEVGPFVCDAARLRQCLEILVQRAVEVDAAEPVRLQLRRDAALLTVHVRDAGVLTPEEQASAFSEFANVRRDGAGLGLVLTRRLVERMGGSLEVVSGAAGTTFTLRVVDQSVASSAAAEALARAAESAVPRDPRAVLLIDDDLDMQDLLGRVLGGAGYRVLGAMDGDRGLALARRILPRVIVLDLVLPGVSGWEILARAKSDPLLAAVPILLLSTLDERPRGLAQGADACFVKPVDRETLLAAVRRLAPTG